MVKRTKLLALLLGATMMVGSTMTAAATSGLDPSTGTGDVLAPIYNMNITNVVVPTNFGVAFNPDGATITTSGTNTSQKQVVSLNYGILQKSSQDKKVTVAFTVEDKNSGDKTVTLATTEDEVKNAEDDSYVLYLQAIPGTGVQIESAAPTKDTDKAKLGDVSMTPDADHAIVANGGKFEFVMGKAEYEPIKGQEVGLGTSDSAVTNNISDKVQVKTLSSNSSSVGFTFDGKMNTNTNWSKLTNGIKISATYTIEDIYNATEYGLVTKKVPAAANSLSTSQVSTVINNLEVGATLSSIVVTKADGVTTFNLASNHYKFADNTFTLVTSSIADPTKNTKAVLTFSDGSTVEIKFVAAD